MRVVGGECLRWQLGSDSEALAWLPATPTAFLASTEDGTVAAFDARNGSGAQMCCDCLIGVLLETPLKALCPQPLLQLPAECHISGVLRTHLMLQPSYLHSTFFDVTCIPQSSGCRACAGIACKLCMCPPSRAGSAPLWRLSAHDAAACSLSFSPAAPSLLATASTDRKVREDSTSMSVAARLYGCCTHQLCSPSPLYGPVSLSIYEQLPAPYPH